MDLSYSAVDFYCGVGGLTHGLIQSGLTVNAGIDIDETCRYAYEFNNDVQFINQDLKDVADEAVCKLFPKNDLKIFVGCAPCQTFSNHTLKNKKRNKDPKWGLLYEYSRLISEIKPTIVSMENVPQIIKSKVFDDFISILKSLGYYVYYSVVFAPDYGVPQRRSRLILLASLLGEIFLVPQTHKPSNYRTLRQAIGKLEPIEAGVSLSHDLLHRSCVLLEKNMLRIKQSSPGGSWREWDYELRCDCHKKESGKTYSSVYGRAEWDKPSPTLTTQFYNYGTGRFGHPEQNRAFSIREGAILQTFPKHYKFIESSQDFSINRLGTHIGNAVPVRLGKIIGKSIIKHLELSYE